LLTLAKPLIWALPLVWLAGVAAQEALGTLLVTSIKMVQVLAVLAVAAATLTPLTAMLPLPAAAVMPVMGLLAAGQLLRMLGVAATLMPLGRVSVKLMPVTATKLPAGLVMVKLNVLVPPAAMVPILSALVRVGVAEVTIKSLVPCRPVPALVLVMVLVVLVKVPVWVAVMGMLTAQPPVGMVAPVMAQLLAVTVRVPPHTDDVPGVCETMPVG
jgi:hypothetical protein